MKKITMATLVAALSTPTFASPAKTCADLIGASKSEEGFVKAEEVYAEGIANMINFDIDGYMKYHYNYIELIVDGESISAVKRALAECEKQTPSEPLHGVIKITQ